MYVKGDQGQRCSKGRPKIYTIYRGRGIPPSLSFTETPLPHIIQSTGSQAPLQPQHRYNDTTLPSTHPTENFTYIYLTVFMSSMSSLLVEQLETYGLPLQYASKVTGMFTGDIITLALRLACVSLLAGFVTGWFRHWKQALHTGKSMLYQAIVLMFSTLSHCTYRG